ncbi:MAG: beta-ketoacyl synthase N-terminal-like domain-containing protein [Cyanobacteria bacterium J06597_16]
MSDPNRSPTKRALLALKKLQAKFDALEAAQREPIAIVGMGCRFPGGADTPSALWQLLQSQTDTITEVPANRWSIEDYHHPDPDTPGKMVTRSGGFLTSLYDFDAGFFRLSPREALSLDPQQRLALELAWEALEQAGIAADQLTATAGRSVGVFLGISSIDHWQQQLARSPEAIDAYLATGSTHSVAAGRVSYMLGVSGPSLAVDTACSSSLVAVHLACQSLRQRECEIALAGGVNRIITPTASINFSKAHMLSADGRCRTFDQAASGFGRAEGGGMIALKRLSDAIASGDRIQAVILGSAVNHNGRSNGITAPSKTAQQAVIQQALSASRLSPNQVDYVETHGTGTALGDPIEVGALGAVFGEQNRDHPLVLGAVKTNLGHAEAAAGMAGLIKAVLAMQHRQIPANLHLSEPNSSIDWASLPFQLPKTTLPWPTAEGLPTAGVSAFGFNGTYAHLVLQAPSPADAQSQPPPNQPPPNLADTRYLLPLSARTPTALTQLVARYAQHLAAYPDVSLAEVCFTASVGRSHFAHRLAILATSPTALRQALIDVLAGRPNPACISRHNVGTGSPNEAVNKDVAGQLSLRHWANRYIQGENLDWPTFFQQCFPEKRYQKQALPTYPFQREYYGP